MAAEKKVIPTPNVPPFILDMLGVENEEELRKELITLGEEQLKKAAGDSISRLAAWARERFEFGPTTAPAAPEVHPLSRDKLRQYYDLVGGNPADSMEDIEKAFRSKVFECDHTNNSEDSEKLRLLIEAMTEIRSARS